MQEYARDGARLIIHSLPQSLLWLVSVEKQDAGSGVLVQNGKVLFVHKDGRRAIPIPASMSASALDATSIHAPSDFSPVYWAKNGRIYVRGESAGGTVCVVEYPLVDVTGEEIIGLPEDLDHLVVYYTAALLSAAKATALTPPTAPSATSAPSIPEVPVSLVLSLPQAPSGFSSVSVNIPALGTPTPLDLSEAVIPAIPSEPAISYTDAVSVAPSATTIAALPQTVPAYTKPTLHADYEGDLNLFDSYAGQEDTDMMASVLQKIEGHLRQYTADIENEQREFEKELALFRDTVARNIEQAKITAQEASQTAQQATDVALRNKAQAVEAAYRDYELTLRRFDASLQHYNLYVQKVVQEHAANVLQLVFVRWQTEAANELRRYEIAVRASEAAASASVEAYAAQVQAQRVRLEQVADQNRTLVERYQHATTAYQVAAAENIQVFSGALERYAALRQGASQDAQAFMGLFDRGLQTFIQSYGGAA